MADYNIYIHSLGGETQQSQTTPWNQNENGQMQPWKSTDESINKNESPENLANAGKVASIAKVAPWVAIAFAVVKTAYSITKTTAEFVALETGDFRVTNAFHDYEAGKNAIFHPISNTVQSIKTLRINRIENQRREMQRSLLGDSEINYYTNRGV